jgi:hypothetical protein
MNRKLLVIALSAVMVGCSSMSGKGIQPSVDAVTPIKDTKISTEFRDEGIKIYYTMSGQLDRIEIIGVSPAWKRNHDVIAEQDAMNKLVQFVYGKNVSTERRVRIISRAIDQASDITSNKFKTVDGTIETDSESLESTDVKTKNGEESQKLNTAKRNAKIVDETLVNVSSISKSSGRLVGVRKIGDSLKDDGKTYVAYYQWSKKDLATSREINNEMNK